MTKRVTTISCSRCGWVRNVAAGSPSGPIRQLHAHAAEEHPADLVPREFDPAARGTVADLLRERHVVLGSEFGP